MRVLNNKHITHGKVIESGTETYAIGKDKNGDIHILRGYCTTVDGERCFYEYVKNNRMVFDGNSFRELINSLEFRELINSLEDGELE